MVAVPSQIDPHFIFVLEAVREITGGWVMLAEYVAVQDLESVTVMVTIPGHKLLMLADELTEGVDEDDSHE